MNVKGFLTLNTMNFLKCIINIFLDFVNNNKKKNHVLYKIYFRRVIKILWKSL